MTTDQLHRLEAIEAMIAEIDEINLKKREDLAKVRRELFAQEGLRDE